MPTERTLPSGLTGHVRELGVEEENLLSNPRHARSGKSLHKVFKACFTDIIDPGPYSFGEEGFEPARLLQGDGLVLLTLIRIEGQGPNYFFDVNCSRCGERIPWEVNLLEFLEENVTKLPNESRIIIAEKHGRFEGKFPRCGKAYKYKLPTLRDELRFPELRRRTPDRLSSALLDLAILEIEGVENKKRFLGAERYPEGHESPERLTSFDANHFRQEMELVNCGLETTFHVECSLHGEVPVELPFREDFLLPKKQHQ